jgi:hypothetical protein
VLVPQPLQEGLALCGRLHHHVQELGRYLQDARGRIQCPDGRVHHPTAQHGADSQGARQLQTWLGMAGGRLRLSDVFTPSLFNSRSALQEFAVAETIFDAIDTDKSGTVELTELAAWLIGQGEKPSAVQGWFAKVQQNLPYAVHRLLNVAHTTPLSLSLCLSLVSLSLSLSLSACHSSTSTKMASSRVMSGRRGGPRAS